MGRKNLLERGNGFVLSSVDGNDYPRCWKYCMSADCVYKYYMIHAVLLPSNYAW